MVLIGGNNVNHPAEPDVLRQLYTINSSSLSGRTIPDYMSMEYSGSVRIRPGGCWSHILLCSSFSGRAQEHFTHLWVRALSGAQRGIWSRSMVERLVGV